MRRVMLSLTLLVAGPAVVGAAQSPAGRYPPVQEYLMPRDAEVALARSAAAANIADRATIEVLTTSGYQVATTGDNGFVCAVLRGYAAPMYTAPERLMVYDAQLRAPICFNPVAARTVWPYQKLRARLGLEGRSPDQIADSVEAAYVRGELPPMEGVAFAYMLSADQRLGPAGAFHPHIMVYAPHNTDALLGNNERGGPLPFVSDDAGTPFAVTVIRVDDRAAIRVRP